MILRDGDVVNIDFLLANQIEQQIERPLIHREVNFVRAPWLATLFHIISSRPQKLRQTAAQKFRRAFASSRIPLRERVPLL